MEVALKYVECVENQWQEILESQRYFLHHIDMDEGCFGFIKTTRSLLSTASFVDGRTPISVDETLWRVPITDALAWFRQVKTLSIPSKFIFHTAFCGSTLLGRLLDVDSRALVLKEPNILAQLSDLKVTRSSSYLDRDQWTALVSFTLMQLNQSWPESHTSVIKPSNWVNTALRDLTVMSGDSRCILLSQSPNQFLTAVFRGGSERIQYIYSFLNHIRPIFPEFHAVLEEVESADLDTVDLFSRLSLITYALQQRAFDQLQELIPGCCSNLRYDQIVSDPVESVQRVVQHLQLGHTSAEISDSVSVHLSRHSKVQERTFRQSDMDRVDQQVLDHYRPNFEAAIDWLIDREGEQVLKI